MWDEAPAKKRQTYEIGAELSAYSIEELEECLMQLTAERERIEAIINAKKLSQDAAQSVFKK